MRFDIQRKSKRQNKTLNSKTRYKNRKRKVTVSFVAVKRKEIAFVQQTLYKKLELAKNHISACRKSSLANWRKGKTISNAEVFPLPPDLQPHSLAGGILNLYFIDRLTALPSREGGIYLSLSVFQMPFFRYRHNRKG